MDGVKESGYGSNLDTTTSTKAPPMPGIKLTQQPTTTGRYTHTATCTTCGWSKTTAEYHKARNAAHDHTCPTTPDKSKQNRPTRNK